MHSSKASEAKEEPRFEAAGVAPGSAAGGHNIVTISTPKSHVVEEYAPEKLKDRKGIRYSDIHRGFEGAVDGKNSRFRLSELARKPLSVEQEEEARIQAEVKRRAGEELSALAGAERERARAEGLEAGKKAARDEVVASARPMLDRLESLVEQLEDMRFDVFKANEDFLIRLAYGIAKMVTLKELVEDRDYVRRLIMHVLERVGTRENIKVFVSPETFLAAEQLRADLAQSVAQLKNISMELDPEVRDPGCRVESDFGEVDARIEVQLRNIADALFEQKA